MHYPLSEERRGDLGKRHPFHFTKQYTAERVAYIVDEVR